MKQNLANSSTMAPGVVPTLPMCLVLAVDAAEHEGGLPRAPWVMRVVIEQLESRMPSMPRQWIGNVRRPGRGVVDSRVRPVIDQLVQGGFLHPRGVGESATWRVGEGRRDDIDDLWRALSTDAACAVRAAAQRSAAIAVAFSKTARPAAESMPSTS